MSDRAARCNSETSPIAPRLAKAIALLASDKPGEVLAAVAAIGRLLATVGTDFHGLAALVTGRIEGAPRAPDVDPDLVYWRQIIARCRHRDDLLRDGEARFLRDLDRRVAAGRPPSPKQADWLTNIRCRQ
jgi:hypothetical protein